MTQLKTVVAAILAVGLLTFATSTFAGDKGEGDESPKPKFDTVDANLDGVITPAEAKDTWLNSDGAFAKVDANHDGLINRSEYETAVS